VGARPLLAGLVAGAALAAAPHAQAQDDPGRWRLAKVTQIPVAYNQGIAVSPARQLFFTSTSGIFRTSQTLREAANTAVAIPADVTQREGYDHIGDLAYDRAEGGRLLLPLECYRQGGPNGGNHCGTGAIGVADPRTLAWRYHVRLDRRHITKAMWAEVSPDGRHLWTSSGSDLLRYDLRAIRRGNAAPTGAALKPTKRLRFAVPPSGITGATFVGRRLFVAGGNEGPAMQIWSIDLKIGERRLEIEREIAGESEGLATIRLFGGTLQWTVLPFDAKGRPPTYGNSGALLSFSARR
jgi:hypothetical protein